jgi:hypothetical protein
VAGAFGRDDASPAPVTGLASARIRRRNVLGGLIKLQARGYAEVLEPYASPLTNQDG